MPLFVLPSAVASREERCCSLRPEERTREDREDDAERADDLDGHVGPCQGAAGVDLRSQLLVDAIDLDGDEGRLLDRDRTRDAVDRREEVGVARFRRSEEGVVRAQVGVRKSETERVLGFTVGVGNIGPRHVADETILLVLAERLEVHEPALRLVRVDHVTGPGAPGVRRKAGRGDEESGERNGVDTLVDHHVAPDGFALDLLDDGAAELHRRRRRILRLHQHVAGEGGHRCRHLADREIAHLQHLAVGEAVLLGREPARVLRTRDGLARLLRVDEVALARYRTGLVGPEDDPARAPSLALDLHGGDDLRVDHPRLERVLPLRVAKRIHRRRHLEGDVRRSRRLSAGVTRHHEKAREGPHQETELLHLYLSFVPTTEWDFSILSWTDNPIFLALL